MALKPRLRRKNIDLTILLINHVGDGVESRYLVLKGDYRYLEGTYNSWDRSNNFSELRGLMLHTSMYKPKFYKDFPTKAFSKAKYPSVVIINLLAPHIRTSE